VIFIDANVPMYLVGAAHPNKIRAHDMVQRAMLARERLVTDAEVLQEILHRYVAVRRHDAIEPAFNALLDIIDDVFPIDRSAVERAKSLVAGYQTLSARDAIHVAIMQEHSIAQIMSFDAGFDLVPGFTRLSS
jgi:predicted nucleic acid-binding protein